MLNMNEYLSGSQPRYVEGTGYVLRCTVTLQPHLVMELLLMMMMMLMIPGKILLVGSDHELLINPSL